MALRTLARDCPVTSTRFIDVLSSFSAATEWILWRPGENRGVDDSKSLVSKWPVLLTKLDEICINLLAIFVFLVIIAFMAMNCVFSKVVTTVDVAFKNTVDAFASFPPKKCLRSMCDNLFDVFNANANTSDIVFTKFVVRFVPVATCFDATRAKLVDAALRLSKI